MVGDNISVTHYSEPEDNSAKPYQMVDLLMRESRLAGIREVVDWIDKNKGWVWSDIWEAKKKEWLGE